MTSFIAWIGVDQQGPASLYFASDSRITWEGVRPPWDVGKKVFACTTQPEIFGFVDYALLPLNALTKAVTAIDCGLRPKQCELSAEGRCDWLWEQIKRDAAAHPESQLRSFKIFYALRTGTKHPIKHPRDSNASDPDIAEFHMFVLCWNHKTNEWKELTINVPTEKSSVLRIGGSGTEVVEDWTVRWHESEQKDTSRVVFSAFCDALVSGADPLSGGAPQLVGIYWNEGAKYFGVHTESTGATFQGSPYTGHESGLVSWRNALFERVTPLGKILPRAQRHSRPKLGKEKKEAEPNL